ncbi:MAG TPA: flagellar biosynthetic protein FliR [Polyangia bacterium]|jgi:flagellar biosynthetic protein FliR|nr:flagellar biosynthetic protein FliR [Polyangia bacterium]
MSNIMLVGGARVIPLAIMLPAFGGRHVPLSIRLALGALLAALAWPLVAAAYGGAGLDRASPLLWILIVGRELAVGVAVGFVASLAFHAAEVAGQLGDGLRGANAAAILIPASDGGAPSPLGTLYLLLATVIFLEIGGLSRVIAALMNSYAAVPLGLSNASVSGMQNAALVVLLASAKLLATALGLAAPLIVAMLLADVALAALARLAPDLPIYFLGLPVKALLGVGVILLGLGALHGTLASGFAGWLDLVNRVIDSFRR